MNFPTFTKARNAFVTITVALVLALSSFFGADVATAHSSSSSQVTGSTAVVTGIQSVWVPYDNAKITSADGCERRRTYLVNNVNWITTSNSRCQSFPDGSRTIWKVKVLSDSGI
jgi:hypothetical protein